MLAECTPDRSGERIVILGVIGLIRRVRALRARLGFMTRAPRVMPYVVPTQVGGGGVAGFALAF